MKTPRYDFAVLLILLLLLIAVPAATQAEEITMNSPALESYLRETLKIQGRPLTTADVANVDEIPYTVMVDDLNDLRHMTGLTKVTLKDAKYKDLEPIASLPNLSDLWLWDTPVEDLSHISLMTNLEFLQLEPCSAKNLDFVSPLQKLISLQIYDAVLMDISGLRPLGKLGSLALKDTEVLANLSVLRDLPRLYNLDVSGTGLESLDTIPALPELALFYVHNNSLQTIGDLSRFPKLTYFHVQNNNISDISGLSTAPLIKRLDLRNNRITDIEALPLLPNLEEVRLEDNPIQSYAPLKRCKKLTKITPENIDWDAESGSEETAESHGEAARVEEDAPTSVPAATQAEEITMNSPSLEAYLRETLKIQGRPLTITDVADVQEIPYTVMVDDLNDLRHMTGLTKVTLKDAKYNDLEPIASLPNLSDLWLWDTPVEDLSHISLMTNLEFLELEPCSAKNLDFVSPLENLISLEIHDAVLTDISGLRPLGKLGTLALEDTEIPADLSVLRDLPRLYSLDVSGTGLKSLDTIPALPKLVMLYVYNNSLQTIGDLSRFPELTYFHVPNNNISDISGLTTAPLIKKLNLRNNRITDIEVLTLLPNLEEVELEDNPIQSYAPLKRCKKLTKVAPEGIGWDTESVSEETAESPGEPARVEEHMEQVRSIEAADSVLPDFASISQAQPLSDKPMRDGALRVMTFEAKDNRAINAFVKAVEAQGFIAARTKDGQQETLQLSHPLLAQGFSMIYAADLKVLTVFYPMEAMLVDLDGLEAFRKQAQPYSFFESVFEQKAREALGGKEGSITREMLSAIKTLSIADRQIADFQDLAMFTGLTSLKLENVGINNLSVLAGLTNLREIYLSGNPVENLKPLAGLNLESLHIRGGKIRDLSPVSKMAELKELWVEENAVSTLPNMAAMTALTDLRLNGNQISDVTNLSKLTTLEVLELSGNQIRQVRPLAKLERLKRLRLNGNPIRDFNTLWVLEGSGSSQFEPFCVLEASTKEAVTTVRVLPGCQNPDSVGQIKLTASVSENVLYADAKFKAKQEKSAKIGGEVTFEFVPLAQYVISASAGTNENPPYLYTPPKPRQFSDFGLRVQRSQLTWLSDDAASGDYFDAFRGNNLRDLAVTRITAGQMASLLNKEQRMVAYLLITMNEVKEAARTDSMYILTAPDGTQAVFTAGYFSWEKGEKSGSLSTDYFSDDLRSYFKMNSPPGEYTLTILFNMELATTFTFTVTP